MLAAAVAVAAAVATAAVQAAPNPAAYPTMDKIPAAVASWSARVLNNIPALPVNAKQLPNPDWSADVTTCRAGAGKVWGISYDDGPSQYTDDLLAQLKSRNLKATFFVIGSRVLANPAVLQRVHAAGHQIGIHTWSHPALTTISNDQVVAEIVYTARIIKEVIGVTPKFMRPPFGDIDERVRAILKNMGLTVVTWNVDSGDSAGSLNVAAQFRQYAASNSGPVISLEHDLFQSAEAQAASALDAILAGGYTIQPVDACTGITPSYDESFWSLVDGTTIASSSSAAASSTTAAAKPTTAASATSAASSTPTQRSSNGAISVTTTSVAALSALVAGVASFFIGTVVV